MSAISTGSQRTSSGDDGRSASRTAMANARPTESRCDTACNTHSESPTILRARWRVGARGSLEVVVARASASISGDDGEVTLTATLDTARRGTRADACCEERSWHGHARTSRDAHGVTEHRLRFEAPGAANGLLQAHTIAIDLVTGLGAAPVLLTDLPLALGLRGGTYVLASVEAATTG